MRVADNIRARSARQQARGQRARQAFAQQPSAVERPDFVDFTQYEYRPDMGDGETDGVGAYLLKARRCVAVEAGYGPHQDIATSNDALVAPVFGAFASQGPTTAQFLAGTDSAIFRQISGGAAWTDVSKGGGYTAADQWVFAQFPRGTFTVLAQTGGSSETLQISTGGNFADVGFAVGFPPGGRTVGIVGQFAIVGGVGGSNGVPAYIRWCAIGDPNDWPEPNTADALSKQAGQEFLDPRFGETSHIAQVQTNTGLVFQEGGIARITYRGGDAVWNVDERFERERGAVTVRGNTAADGAIYFISRRGFHRTNGQQVQDIGFGKVDRQFYNDLGTLDDLLQVSAGVDPIRNLIYWYSPAASKLYLYNYKLDQWTTDDQALELVFSGAEYDILTKVREAPVMAIGADRRRGTFTGADRQVEIETADQEWRPGEYTQMQTLRPLVEGSPSLIEGRVASRNVLTDAAVNTAYTGLNTRTNVAEFRDKGAADGRWLRTALRITGGFKIARGMQLTHSSAGGVDG